MRNHQIDLINFIEQKCREQALQRGQWHSISSMEVGIGKFSGNQAIATKTYHIEIKNDALVVFDKKADFKAILNAEGIIESISHQLNAILLSRYIEENAKNSWKNITPTLECGISDYSKKRALATKEFKLELLESSTTPKFRLLKKPSYQASTDIEVTNFIEKLARELKLRPFSSVQETANNNNLSLKEEVFMETVNIEEGSIKAMYRIQGIRPQAKFSPERCIVFRRPYHDRFIQIKGEEAKPYIDSFVIDFAAALSDNPETLINLSKQCQIPELVDSPALNKAKAENLYTVTVENFTLNISKKTGAKIANNNQQAILLVPSSKPVSSFFEHSKDQTITIEESTTNEFLPENVKNLKNLIDASVKKKSTSQGFFLPVSLDTWVQLPSFPEKQFFQGSTGKKAIKSEEFEINIDKDTVTVKNLKTKGELMGSPADDIINQFISELESTPSITSHGM